MQKGYEMAFKTAERSGEMGIRLTSKNQTDEFVPLESHSASIPQLYALEPSCQNRRLMLASINSSYDCMDWRNTNQ